MTRAIAGAAALLLVLAGCAMAPAPTTRPAVPLDHLPALKGDYFPLQSHANGHLYHIYVRLPEGYGEAPGKTYPIVYLLDGDSLFPILAANHLFLTYDDKLPEAIVVGIAYGSFAKPTNRRHIDFMPPGPDESGTATFHQFLKEELLPAVERRHRADPSRRIIMGSSRAGAMILYSAFADPDLFWGRIASNPSLRPGREIFFGKAPAARRRDLRLIVALGSEEDPERRAAALEWVSHWQSQAAAPWAIEVIDIQGGTHSANTPDVYRRSLRSLFPRQP